MVQHILAEIALCTVGTRDGVAAHHVTILAARHIFRRADLDPVGTAERVIILAETRYRNLAALRAGAKHQHNQHQRGNVEQTPRSHANFPAVSVSAANCLAPNGRNVSPDHTLDFSASPISSSTLGSSIVAGMVHSSPSAIFLMVPRRIFPERVFGSRPTVMASLNAATGPSLSRTSATISFSISAGSRLTPAFSTTKPHGASPLMASLMPSTAHSATSGCEARISSMPPVESR